MPPKSRTPVAKRGPGSDADFEYDSSVGLIVVPSLSKAKPPNAFKMMEIEAIENPSVQNARQSLYLLELAAGDDPEMTALIRKLDVVEFGDFMEQWGKHSGVDMGNS